MIILVVYALTFLCIYTEFVCNMCKDNSNWFNMVYSVYILKNIHIHEGQITSNTYKYLPFHVEVVKKNLPATKYKIHISQIKSHYSG